MQCLLGFAVSSSLSRTHLLLILETGDWFVTLNVTLAAKKKGVWMSGVTHACTMGAVCGSMAADPLLFN